MPGLGISSIGSALTKHGYHQKEYLTFPGKKLLATWFAPPQELYSYLPRVFVSELQVEKLSAESQVSRGSGAHASPAHAVALQVHDAYIARGCRRELPAQTACRHVPEQSDDEAHVRPASYQCMLLERV